MATLSDKLKALGVKVGTAELPKPAPAEPRFHSPSQLDLVLGGAPLQTPLGETYSVEIRYPTGTPHGHSQLALRASLGMLGRWAGYPHLDGLPSSAFAFLDIETTGLQGGAGTYAFLVGVGRFEHEDFHLAQFFLRDPNEEPAQLGAIEAFLAPCQALVTFNGKAFDAPLLYTRYLTHGWHAPLAELMHVDLLHLARRLWRDRLPNRSLGYLEAHILQARRTEDDVPGWMVPDLYFQYLRSGDPERLRGVFYHNAMDVLSLAALMDHMAALLNDPVAEGSQHGIDLIALGKLFEDLGETATAVHLYLHGLDHDDARQDRLPRSVLLQAIDRLAAIHKRRLEWESAIQLWQQAANRRHLNAFIELAKCYEHNLKDIAAALEWTQAAIDAVQSAPTYSTEELYLSLYERRLWLEQLKHRLERLQLKLARRPAAGVSSDEP